MKQSLQLRVGQQLTMTPQLQQAIRLLQLSTLDLQAEIQQALDSNPMLELTEDEGADDEARRRDDPQDYAADELQGEGRGAEGQAGAGDQPEQTAKEFEELGASMEMTGNPDELPVDSAWEDVYDNSLPKSYNADQDGRDYEYQHSVSESLREHLLWQMHLTPFTDKDMAVAVAIIDAINERGYLATPLEEIHEGLQTDLEVEFDEVEAVLHQIQNFDPAGVGARDLRECLLLQLQHSEPVTPVVARARQLIGGHLDLLAGREFAEIMRILKCTQEDLMEVVALVQSLNPRPGNQVTDRRTEYIVPDVIVRKEEGAWKVELNSEAIPRVRINAGYAGLVRRADNSSDNAYLKNRLQEARWFVKSLQSRNETLLKVASCIVERQRAFLEHGEEAMKALVLHDVAKAVDMHESTISRVTTQKYMHTPRGVFELKYFFSSHVGTSDGGECSATAIRALIKKLVAGEDRRKPLSDSKIAELLKEQGINVARRTIAKYREALSIASSSERKQLV